MLPNSPPVDVVVVAGAPNKPVLGAALEVAVEPNRPVVGAVLVAVEPKREGVDAG